MPVLSRFQSGSGASGIPLPPVTGITTQPASGSMYIKWTDPEDVVVDGSTLATWAGTVLVRKAGSMPAGRRDGVQILDSKTRNAYKDTWFADSGLTNGTVYYYKFFPYTTDGVFTNDDADEFTGTPVATPPGNVSRILAFSAGNGKLAIRWTDPAETIEQNGVVVSRWDSTRVIVTEDAYATSYNTSTYKYRLDSKVMNQYQNNPLVVSGLENGKTYYVRFYPVDKGGAVNTATANRTTGVADRVSLVALPSQNDTGANKLIYTGENQNPVWKNYDSSALSGVWVAQTNAGTYTASFTPKADYKWAASLLDDGEDPASTKNVSWKIWQAPGSLSTDKASVTLYGSQETVDVTISGTYDGTLSVESSDTSVAVVSLSGNVATISGTRKTGSIVVTISATGGTNYADQTITISVDALFTLEETPWSVISEISAAGLGSNYWEVGDTKSVTLTGDFMAVCSNYGGEDNIWDRTTNPLEQGSIKTADGTDLASTTRVRTNGYIPVKPNTTYRVTAENVARWSIREYKEDKSFYKTSDAWISFDTPYTTDSSTKFIRVLFSHENDNAITPAVIPWISIVEQKSFSVTLYCYIIGFNHNSAKEGTGIQFGTWKDAGEDGNDICLAYQYGALGTNGSKHFSMNHWGGNDPTDQDAPNKNNVNYGGWKGCDLRYDVLGSTDVAPSGYGATLTTNRAGYDASATTATNPVAGTLMSCLPADLRAVMKPITKYTDNVGNGSNTEANVTASVDYLPLLAEFEVLGTRSYANQYEQNSQTQYQYYVAGNSKVKNRRITGKITSIATTAPSACSCTSVSNGADEAAKAVGCTADNPSSASGNLYAASGSTGYATYSFDFSGIPNGATITGMSVVVCGKRENSTQDSTHVAKIQLYTNTTAKGTAQEFTSTSQQTITLSSPGTWTQAELLKAKMRFTVAYYGGMVYGATWTVDYELENQPLKWYTRSVGSASYPYFRALNESGASGYIAASVSGGIAPVFMV